MRMKPTVVRLAVTALLVTWLSGAGSAAVAAPEYLPEADEQYSKESFSVAGDLGVEVGDTVEASNLRAIGLDENTTEHAINGSSLFVTLPLRDADHADSGAWASSTEAAGMVATAANAPIRYSWTEKDGWIVTLRSNINDKIVNTHNVSWRVARAVTQHPEEKWLVSGTKYNYSIPVNDVRCTGLLWWRECKVVRTVTVIAGVDFRANTSDGNPFGVTTTYCRGIPGKCPDFVKNALNI